MLPGPAWFGVTTLRRTLEARRGSKLLTIIVAVLLTWLFFLEYLPPVQNVHLWSDIEGYHYPLLNYASRSLRAGRIPLWDPSIYCGIPFAGNVQVGLFYPPNWALFLAGANIPRHLQGSSPDRDGRGLRYLLVQELAFLHITLTFLFAYWWLRERASRSTPAALGALVAALGGYPLSQMNHLGVICGYAWIPFALWGIEQAGLRKDWRPLWKVATAATMCFLAGYPPTVVGLAVIAATYACTRPDRIWLLPRTCVALAVAAPLAAVQLLPAMEATALKHPDSAFGSALPSGAGLYASMLLPNWFDQNRNTTGVEASAGDYLYLGAPALLGIVWLLRRGRFNGAGASLTIAGVSLFLAADPLGIVLPVVVNTPVIADLLRRYSLLPGVGIAAALLAASACNDLLGGEPPRTRPRLLGAVWLVAALAWCGYLFSTTRFAVAWHSLIYAAATVALLLAGLTLLRSLDRWWISAALLLVALAEYHAFGTNRRFNAADGNVDRILRGDARLGGGTMFGVSDDVYRAMRDQPQYRVAAVSSITPTDLRFYGLSGPQGGDPFLPEQYRKAIEPMVTFTSNRLFNIDPDNEAALRFFGIRWIITRDETAEQKKLESDSRFRRTSPFASFYIVYEYLGSKPAYRFNGDVAVVRWSPHHRHFDVNSASGGRFVLVEQFYPGWRARIDGGTATLIRAGGTFQSADVPPGRHRVTFDYQPVSVYAGAAVSLAATMTLAWAVRRPASPRP